MGTLKQFYRNVLQNRVSFVTGTNEERIPALELESHLTTVTYGGFTLTDAVRPSLDLKIIPEEGYKHDKIKLEYGRMGYKNFRRLIPILVASVSLERLFETFLAMLNPLGDHVSVALETSHCHSGTIRTDLHREHIDLPVLKSFLYDHEDLLLHDGCTGISVESPKMRAEVRLDEHKLIIVYARQIASFEKILRRHRIPHKETMPLLTEAEHVHITRDEYFHSFKTLQTALGMDGSYTAVR